MFNQLKVEDNLTASIRGIPYPVVKVGKGIPCLCIGLGTLMIRSLSKEFTDLFEVYSSDTYWIESASLQNPEAMTIDTILDDINELGDSLHLKNYVIFAHSAFGIIALEFAKKYPDVAAAIIMIGTPVNANSETIKNNELIFQENADKKRKKIDAKRRAEVANQDLSQLSSNERWRREYIYRDAPRYWHVPDFDCSLLWENVQVNQQLDLLFSKILPDVNVLKGLERVTTPVFLAAGMSDYDCCPWQWKTVPNLPALFTISVFAKSGHYPHYEEANLFDARIKEWVRTVSRCQNQNRCH